MSDQEKNDKRAVFRRVSTGIEVTLCVPNIGPRKVTWNDEYFEKNIVPKCHRKGPIAKTVSVAAATELVNWYVKGEDLSNPLDTVLAVFYRMQVSGSTPIFHGDLQKDDYPDLVTSGPESITEVESYESVLDGENSIRGLPNATRVEAWRKQMIALLNCDGNNSDDAINLIGFIMLTMFRMTVKDEKQVSKQLFFRTLKHFKEIFQADIAVQMIPPPHLKAIESFKRNFNRFSLNSNAALSAMVYSHGKAKGANIDKIRDILMAGCLEALSKVGLGMIQWTQEASKKLSVDIFYLLKLMSKDFIFCSTSRDLSEALNTCVLKETEYSWPWSRMMADGAFYTVRTNENIEYAMVLMALTIDANPNDEKWNISSFKRDLNKYKSKAIDMANHILEIIKKEKTVNCST